MDGTFPGLGLLFAIALPGALLAHGLVRRFGRAWLLATFAPVAVFLAVNHLRGAAGGWWVLTAVTATMLCALVATLVGVAFFIGRKG
jgi:hypothetical protein